MLGLSVDPVECLQSNSSAAICWPAKAPVLPAGTQQAVLSRSYEFLAIAEGVTRHPYWPGLNSGISIGVGWDLGQHSESELQADWAKLGADNLSKLKVA